MKCLIIFQAVICYVFFGFLTAAYVHEHRSPTWTTEEHGYPGSYFREGAESQHDSRSSMAGVVWPVYWTARGVTWVCEQCWRGALWVVTPGDLPSTAPDSSDVEHEPWPGAREGKKPPYREPPRHLSERW